MSDSAFCNPRIILASPVCEAYIFHALILIHINHCDIKKKNQTQWSEILSMIS